jgi:hypothetical protein
MMGKTEKEAYQNLVKGFNNEIEKTNVTKTAKISKVH